MSYTIGTVIYGVFIDVGIGRCIEAYEALGFDFDASEGSVGWAGYELYEFDECQPLALSSLEAVRLQVTEGIKTKVAARVAAFPSELREGLSPVDFWIVWRSS